jgi:predicted phage terminase large subunit-like protein
MPISSKQTKETTTMKATNATNPDKLTKGDFELILQNRGLRSKLAEKDPYWFFHLYFPEYIKCPTAPFQKQLFKDLASDTIKQLVVVSFRGSAKSTIATMAYPLWAIIGSQQKKYIVIASQTQAQAQQHLRNIRDEIESNALFRGDFGPLEAESNEWGISALYIPQFKAKIIAVSRGQSIRGLRHGARRPDLVICDDIEDSESVKTAESRGDTDKWFNSEIKGVGDRNTKFVVVGNLLHEDSLVMRLKQSILAGKHPSERYCEYPLMKDGDIFWPGMYPDLKSIEDHMRQFNYNTWMREFMLKIIPEEGQIVTLDMLDRYDNIPPLLKGETERHFVGVDLAISQRTSADYTAAVSIVARNVGKETMKLYVKPLPVNERMSFAKTIDRLSEMRRNNPSTIFIIETTGYQDAVAQTMRASGAKVVGIKPGIGKNERLNIAAAKIEQGIVRFPEKGCEALIHQITGFGIEKHDDLVDAFTSAIIYITGLADKKPGGGVYWSGRRRNPIRSNGSSQGKNVVYQTQNGVIQSMYDPYGW